MKTRSFLLASYLLFAGVVAVHAHKTGSAETDMGTVTGVTLGDAAVVTEVAAPGTPGVGTGYLYANSADGKLYYKDDLGTAYDLTATGAGLSGGTDNRITRWDGATAVQSSTVIIDDSGNTYNSVNDNADLGTTSFGWRRLYVTNIGNTSGDHVSTIWVNTVDDEDGTVDVAANLAVTGAASATTYVKTGTSATCTATGDVGKMYYSEDANSSSLCVCMRTGGGSTFGFVSAADGNGGNPC